MIKPNYFSGGRKRRSKKKTGSVVKKRFSDSQKKALLNNFVSGLMALSAKIKRSRSNSDYKSELKRFAASFLPTNKQNAFMVMWLSGKIFSWGNRGTGPDFCVVPNRFLSKSERTVLKGKMNHRRPNLEVVTLSEFEKWAFDNFDFSELKKQLDK